METTRPQVRYNTKPCKHCGAMTSVLAAFSGPVKTTEGWRNGHTDEAGRTFVEDNGSLIVECRGGCGHKRLAHRVFGKLNLGVKCDARCTHAKGISCECSCGGKNHGQDYNE